ncbi:TraR/DksA family transcriptional regulator [Streptomyces sp. NPDC127066]|uniref:TraR/DksA family transcriptional regulator n=1 Tax=Streptomyces sp. NPDC127066 TaxID=3347125 RepID=UPI00365988F0
MNHQTVDGRDTELSLDDFAVLRENLREQLLFRREQLRQLSEAATRADPFLDRRTAAQMEVRVKLTASASMVLTDVEAALARMDQGHYGICHLCRRPMTREQLMVVPQARYCGRCQHVREAGP